MIEREDIEKLMEYAKTLGIHIEQWEMSREATPRWDTNRQQEFMPMLDIATLTMKARCFPVPKPIIKKPTFLIHIGNYKWIT